MTAPDRPGDRVNDKGCDDYCKACVSCGQHLPKRSVERKCPGCRPGDRDQQQAAEAALGAFANPNTPEMVDRVARAIAAARAEEAARWRAKIEALADEWAGEVGYCSDALRALLDAE